MLKKENLDCKLSLCTGCLSNEPVELDTPLTILIKQGYAVDSFPNQVFQMLHNKVQQSRKISLDECNYSDGRLTYCAKIYIPECDPLKLAILQTHHDAPAAGHAGCIKAFEIISCSDLWSKMREYIH